MQKGNSWLAFCILDFSFIVLHFKMQILNAGQLRLWDQYTIQHEGIASLDLMERAAGRCLDWLEKNHYLDKSFCIFCGKGNNGGDGLALARMLSAKKSKVVVYILEFGHKGTEDFQVNLARLHQTHVEIRFIQTEETLQSIPANEIFIDALFGSGLNRPLEPMAVQLIEHINETGNEIISIDIPSGMYVDKSSKDNAMVRADHTLSFQCFKPAFLVAENEPFIGELHILDIGLLPDFLASLKNDLDLVDMPFIHALYKPRKKFAHKGNFGHALLVAGSYGKMGAALLAAKACLRTGAGLLTCHIPASGYTVLQTALPEAMIETDEENLIISAVNKNISGYSAVGLGPGIGKDEKTKDACVAILKGHPASIVIDADALNIIATHPELLSRLPPYSILTPHPKEFERLFGEAPNDFERIAMARKQSKAYQCIIILKGHNSFIAIPGGAGYFNTTGNAGMAKGGSGDALTGIITGLLAQGYSAPEAAIFGVYLHGLAGDLAARIHSQESMLPSDLIDCLGKAFQAIEA